MEAATATVGTPSNTDVFPISKYYTPLPSCLPFHASKHKFRALAGGIGSGKSVAGVWESILMCLRYPGNEHLIGRKTLADLKKTTLLTFFEQCPRDLIYSFNKQDMTLCFRHDERTGKRSVIHFMGVDEIRKAKSLNLGSFFVDEGTEIQVDVYRFLEGRLRNPNGPRRGWVCTNVEGKDPILYHHFHPKGKFYKQNHKYWVSTTLDNPYLPKDYVDDLLSYGDSDNEAMRSFVRRYVYADFVVFEGQIYPGFREKTHVIDPIDIPAKWHKYRVIDHGMSHNPTACVWIAVDEDGNVFIYREYEAVGKLIDDNARAIRELSGDEVYEQNLCDPSMFNRNQQGKKGWVSVADLYREMGVVMQIGDNSKSRFERLNALIAVDPNRIHPITGELGAPRLFVTKECPATIEEIESRQWKKLKVTDASSTAKEEARDGNDDHVDCVEYFANYYGMVGFRTTPRPEQPKPWYVIDEGPSEVHENWVANY